MNIDKIPTMILGALRNRLTDEAIQQASPREAFAQYCEWYGLIAWGDTLWDVIESLKAAKE